MRGEYHTIKLWTDGSGMATRGPIGWAFAVTCKDNKLIHCASGSMDAGTNNIAEILAVTKALEYCYDEYHAARIEVYSDSMYVIGGATEWIDSWQSNGWKTSRKKPVANQEYWMQLKKAIDKLQIVWHHVKAHSGSEFNEMADKLAGIARKNHYQEVLND